MRKMIDRTAGSVPMLDAEAVFDDEVNSASTLLVGTIVVPSVDSVPD